MKQANSVNEKDDLVKEQTLRLKLLVLLPLEEIVHHAAAQDHDSSTRMGT